MPRSLRQAVFALAGVFVSVAMVLLGLPETNPAQSVLLELSSLPLSVAVGIGVWMLHERADRPLGPRSLRALLVGAAAVGSGLLLMVWAYAFGPRGVVHAGQGLIWLGLFAAMVVMVRRQPRARATRFELADDIDDQPDALDPDTLGSRGPAEEEPTTA